MTEELAPLIVAIPTPFDARGRLDVPALQRLVRYACDRPVRGVAVLTELGEDAVLLPAERRQVVKVAASAVSRPAELWVTVSAAWTREAVDLARDAVKLGAQGILLTVPAIPGLRYPEVYRQVERVGRATDRGIVLQFGARCGLTGLAAEELDTLGRHERLEGVWIAEASVPQVEGWARRLRHADRRVWWPCAFTFGVGRKAGADGALCSLALLAPDLAVRSVRAPGDGDERFVRSVKKQTQLAVELMGPHVPGDEREPLQRLASRVAGAGTAAVPAGASAVLVKEALRLQGHRLEAHVRPPFASISTDERERLKAVLKASGLLT